jgi:hypothetical protein
MQIRWHPAHNNGLSHRALTTSGLATSDQTPTMARLFYSPVRNQLFWSRTWRVCLTSTAQHSEAPLSPSVLKLVPIIRLLSLVVVVVAGTAVLVIARLPAAVMVVAVTTAAVAMDATVRQTGLYLTVTVWASVVKRSRVLAVVMPNEQSVRAIPRR